MALQHKQEWNKHVSEWLVPNISGRLVPALVSALAMHGVLWTLLSLTHAGVDFWYLAYLPAMALLAFYFGWPAGLTLLISLCLSHIFQWPWVRSNPVSLLPLVILSLMWLALMQWVRRHRIRLLVLKAEWNRLLGGTGEAVFILDANGCIVDASPAAQQLQHQSLSRMRGLTLDAVLDNPHPAGAGNPTTYFRNAIEKSLLTNRPVKLEYSIPAAASQLPSISLVGVAMPWRLAGSQSGVVVILNDQTEQRQLEAHLAEAERHLAIGQMAAGITHDFNNILEVIEKATAILALNAGASDADQQPYLRAIHLGVVRGGETLRRLREYLAGGLGGQELLDVSDLARDAMELTRPLWRHQEQVSIQAELQSVQPVRGNAVDLRRLITNLLLNSLEAIKDHGGQITIRTRNEGQRVRCIVSDNGPGIPLEAQPYIFRPYFTTKAKGSGLGLAEAQKIALSHQGRLSFQSEPGKGTEFVLDLPGNPASMAQSA